MKIQRMIFVALLLFNTAVIVSCQENLRAPQPDFLNLIPADSIPFAQLPVNIQQRIIAGRVGPILDVRVISNPFPDPLQLFEIRQLRCNMSETRIFYAERTKVQYDYSLSRPDIRWEGNLVGTGVNTGNSSDNKITLWARSLPNKQYTFGSALLEVSLTERYRIYQEPSGYWFLVKYDPTKISVPSDSLRSP